MLSLSAIALGCSVNVSFPVGFACKDGVCPDGQSCVRDICVVGDGAIDAGSDAPSGDGGGTTRVCGGSSAYTEDFSDASAGWLLDNLRAGVTVTDAINLSVPAAEDDAFATSGPRFDLIDSDWFGRVIPSANGQTSFAIKEAEGTLSIAVEADEIVFSQDFDGAVQTTYDPVEHRYLGFRERDGNVEFVTSPDGLRFSSQRVVATPVYASHFQALMRVERGPGAGDPSASFDDINGGQTPTHTFCKATDVSDDFGDDALSAHWSVFGSCSEVVETDGEVRFVSEVGQFCVLASRNLHDLTNSQFELELGSVFSGYFKYAVDGESGELIVERFDTEIRVTDCPGYVCGQAVIAPYNSERYWRFSGDSDGVITFSLSPDGTVYRDISSATPGDITAVKARFHGNTGTENRVTRFN